jgi:hypothetical protein
MVPCCPTCGHQMRISELQIGGLLSCPWCKEKFVLPGSSFLENVIMLGATIVLSARIACWLAPKEYSWLFYFPLTWIVGLGVGAAWGLFRGWFWPRKLKRDDGWPDDGSFLHITPPPATERFGRVARRGQWTDTSIPISLGDPFPLTDKLHVCRKRASSLKSGSKRPHSERRLWCHRDAARIGSLDDSSNSKGSYLF